MEEKGNYGIPLQHMSSRSDISITLSHPEY